MKTSTPTTRARRRGGKAAGAISVTGLIAVTGPPGLRGEATSAGRDRGPRRTIVHAIVSDLLTAPGATWDRDETAAPGEMTVRDARRLRRSCRKSMSRSSRMTGGSIRWLAKSE